MELVYHISLIIVTVAAMNPGVQASCSNPNYKDPAMPSGASYPSTSSQDHPDTPAGLLTKENAAEYVTLRYSSRSFDNQRTGCPHEQGDLVNWHDPSIWPGNQVPLPGSTVVLPESTKVLVSSCSLHTGTPYQLITIPASSELILSDSNIEIHVNGIIVEGALRIGSETCRFLSNIEITLYGSRPMTDQPKYVKGIQVTNAILDIHGTHYTPTWTRLAKTASPGDTVIYLQDQVNWEVGQQVVIVATEVKDSRDWHRNEVKTIVGKYRNAIEIDSGLAYTHFGGQEYQAEVGLLTRRIKVMGSPSDSEPTDTSPVVCSGGPYSSYPCENTFLTGYGGHIIVEGTEATGRVRGVELYRMGQTNFLARYPFHLHQIFSGGVRSYITDSSVHHSFYRCYTIHGTYGALVSENVAYDAIGHCYYLEDGVEENNTISYNLAAHIHFMEEPRYAGAQFMSDVTETDDLRNPADTTASGFYITNAYNRIIGNSASGGYSGYAFVRVDNPLKLNRDMDISPSRRPNLEFDGNVCHSSGFWWVMAGCIYVGGKLEHVSEGSDLLRYNPGRDSPSRNTNGYMQLTNTKVFLSQWGINHWGSRSNIINVEAHDIQRPIAVLGHHYISNLLINCRTGFQPEQPRNEVEDLNPTWIETKFSGSYMGFEWYDVFQRHILTNATFRNCALNDGTSVWRTLTHSDQFVPENMQASKNIVYENVQMDKLIRPSVESRITVSGRLQSWIDVDGSAAGRKGRPSLIGSAINTTGTWWKLDDTCSDFQNGRYWLCDLENSNNAFKLNRSVGSLQLKFDSSVQDEVGTSICGNGNLAPCEIIGVVTHFGRTKAEGMALTPNTRITGPTNGLGWFISLDQGSPKNLEIELIQVAREEIMLIAIPYPSSTTFSIAYVAPYCAPSCQRHEFIETDSLSTVIHNETSDKYYFDGSYLYLRVTAQRNYVLDFDTPGGPPDLDVFEREGIVLPELNWGAYMEVIASNCGGDDTYCDSSATNNLEAPKVCETLGLGSETASYDSCSSSNGGNFFDSLLGTVVLIGSAAVATLLFAGAVVVVVRQRSKPKLRVETELKPTL